MRNYDIYLDYPLPDLPAKTSKKAYNAAVAEALTKAKEAFFELIKPEVKGKQIVIAKDQPDTKLVKIAIDNSNETALDELMVKFRGADCVMTIDAEYIGPVKGMDDAD